MAPDRCHGDPDLAADLCRPASDGHEHATARLAELTGMSSETVIRTLKKFEAEGLIEMKGKKFEVLDYKRLKQISEKG